MGIVYPVCILDSVLKVFASRRIADDPTGKRKLIPAFIALFKEQIIYRGRHPG
jgi:hypothetical protein